MSAEVTPAPASTKQQAGLSHPWSSVPIGSKVAWLSALGVSGGCLCGAMLGNGLLNTAQTLAAAAMIFGGLAYLFHRSLVTPIHTLLDHLERADRTQRAMPRVKALNERGDELGRLAHLARAVSIHAHRGQTEAQVLRKSMDHRVAEATQRATQQLTTLANRDPLTGLGNRRFLDNQLDQMSDSCDTAAVDLVCVLIDLDAFKSVNDTQGHAAGDRLLVVLAELIRSCIRRGDLTARYGGDEFIILMPDCTKTRAARFIEQVMRLFNQHINTTLPRQLKVGLSAGIASSRRDNASDGRHLIELADAYLYQAKRAGKGQYCGV